MIYFIIVSVVLVIGIWLLNRSDSYYGSELTEIASILSTIVSGLYLFVGGIGVIIAQTVEFPAFKAEYDQTSALIQNVNPAAAEDLVGQVATINAKLAKAKLYNNYSFCDPYWSDKFETLSPIVLPEHLKNLE